MKVISPVMLVATLALLNLETTQADKGKGASDCGGILAARWAGRSLSELVAAWGDPSEIHGEEETRRLVIYRTGGNPSAPAPSGPERNPFEPRVGPLPVNPGQEQDTFHRDPIGYLIYNWGESPQARPEVPPSSEIRLPVAFRFYINREGSIYKCKCRFAP